MLWVLLKVFEELLPLPWLQYLHQMRTNRGWTKLLCSSKVTNQSCPSLPALPRETMQSPARTWGKVLICLWIEAHFSLSPATHQLLDLGQVTSPSSMSLPHL